MIPISIVVTMIFGDSKVAVLAITLVLFLMANPIQPVIGDAGASIVSCCLLAVQHGNSVRLSVSLLHQ